MSFLTFFLSFIIFFKIFCNFAHMNDQIETYKKIHFAVMAIESGARKMNINGSDMYRRLKRQGLIHRRLFRHYNELHTQSLDWVANDIAETLMNWEKEAQV